MIPADGIGREVLPVSTSTCSMYVRGIDSACMIYVHREQDRPSRHLVLIFLSLSLLILMLDSSTLHVTASHSLIRRSSELYSIDCEKCQSILPSLLLGR